MPLSPRTFNTIAVVFMLAVLPGCMHAPVSAHLPRIEPVGEFALPDDAPEGLSGIAWMGGDRYAMAEDSGGRVHFARIAIDEASGAVTNCVFESTRTVNGLSDAEGIAYDPTIRSLYVSDESGPKILLLRENGDTRGIDFPEFFRQARGNKSLEALSLEVRDGRPLLWAANEDALRCDGQVSSATNSSLVRIAAFAPGAMREDAGQWWFYQLDMASGKAIPGLQRSTPFNGLSGFAALGGGRLLVLERSCGLLENGQGEGALIAISVYFVETSGAKMGSTLRKTLVHRQTFDRSNYEGMTLGPVLADGSRVLLLVADGDVMSATVGGYKVDFPWRKALLSLRLDMGGSNGGGK